MEGGERYVGGILAKMLGEQGEGKKQTMELKGKTIRGLLYKG